MDSVSINVMLVQLQTVIKIVDARSVMKAAITVWIIELILKKSLQTHQMTIGNVLNVLLLILTDLLRVICVLTLASKVSSGDKTNFSSLLKTNVISVKLLVWVVLAKKLIAQAVIKTKIIQI
jgi:hypothetical protein